jgi:hypothetical protein
MFNSRGKRNPKKKVTKEVLVADGRTQATIPVRGGAGLPNPESKLSLDFVANAVTTVTITWRNILDLVVMGTTTTQLADVFYSCRLHSVEIWTPDAAAGVVANWPSLAFDSPSQGDQRVFQIPCTANGGYAKCKPAKSSINGLTWQTSSSVGCFTLNNIGVGTIVRINATFRARMGSGSATIAANAGSSVVAGTMYLRGLDGLATASSAWNCIPAAYQI